jgi:hypothetical protein
VLAKFLVSNPCDDMTDAASNVGRPVGAIFFWN